jgi:hypothetical protein
MPALPDATSLATTTRPPVADVVLEGGGVKGLGLVARSVYVDTSGVSSFDFDLDAEGQRLLLARGRSAAEAFLARWDYDRWLRDCRGVPA